MHRALFISLLGAAVLGCGGGPSPVSLPGSFTMIEASVNDVSATIQDKRYKANGELGTETDRLGIALSIFVNEAKGGPHEADAKAIRDKVSHLEKLANTRAPVAKQREAVKDLQATIAAVKEKL